MRRISPILAVVGIGVSVWLAASVGASATVPTAHDDWAQNGAGAKRQSYNRAEVEISKSSIGHLRLAAGGFTHNCCGMTRPIVSGGVVYTEVHTGGASAVEAWDETTRAPLWTTDTPSALTNNFAVSDGVLVVSDFYGNLLGFSTTDGSLLWSSPSGGGSAQPVIANGVVYVTYGHIQALDLQTGAILWTGQTIDDLGQSGPAVRRNQVFQYAGGSIYAFDTGDGHLLWSAPCPTGGPQNNDRSPMVLGGVVYEGSGCAINATTGTPLWNPPTNRISLTADATGGRRIFTGYQVSRNGSTYARMAALDRTTGAMLWHHDVANNFSTTALGSGPIVANGLVYFTDRTGTDTIIRAFDADTGKQIWKSTPVGGVYGISIADGRLWAIFGNDNLVRYWALP